MPQISQRVSQWFERGEELLDLVGQRLGRRGRWFFAALSMAWGVVSGISLRRDYDHSRQLVGYLALWVLASALFRIWVEYARRLSKRRTKIGGMRHFLLRKPGLVAGVAHYATQSACQYIAMFCLPLLVLAEAWTTLALTAALALVSLVDPWWARFANLGWCMALVRTFTAVIASSFAFPVFFPEQLAFFYPCLGTVAALSALPWDALIAWRPPGLRDAAPALAVLVVVGAEGLMHKWLRVPVLSIWLAHPGLGTNVENHELGQRWRPQEEHNALLAALADGDAVCCFTPVISPSGVAAPITHEWLVDGVVVDRIRLHPIRGQGEQDHRPFRTYSCKHHLPAGEGIHSLGCRAYLGDELYLGRADVSFR